MESEEKKKSFILNLKNETIKATVDGFVDDFNFWNAQMKSINDIIGSVDKGIELFKYDDFCKMAYKITQDTLEKKIDYEALFITKDEAEEVQKEFSENEELIRKKMALILEGKYRVNFIAVINASLISNSVKSKLGDKFKEVAPLLQDSILHASLKLKKGDN